MGGKEFTRDNFPDVEYVRVLWPNKKTASTNKLMWRDAEGKKPYIKQNVHGVETEFDLDSGFSVDLNPKDAVAMNQINRFFVPRLYG